VEPHLISAMPDPHERLNHESLLAAISSASRLKRGYGLHH
jgi:hypothetical protein